LSEKKYTCQNPKCKNVFDKPKLVQYYVCPYCSTKIKKESQGQDCSYYLGYLKEREKGEAIPKECVECRKSIECMLADLNSKRAVKEIKKWYK
jgi:hypothetical protein